MSGSHEKPRNGWSRFKLSLDTWAVVSALAAALLVRAGVLKHIPW